MMLFVGWLILMLVWLGGYAFGRYLRARDQQSPVQSCRTCGGRGFVPVQQIIQGEESVP